MCRQPAGGPLVRFGLIVARVGRWHHGRPSRHVSCRRARAEESGARSWPSPSATLDESTDQLRCFDTRDHPTNILGAADDRGQRLAPRLPTRGIFMVDGRLRTRRQAFVKVGVQPPSRRALPGPKIIRVRTSEVTSVRSVSAVRRGAWGSATSARMCSHGQGSFLSSSAGHRKSFLPACRRSAGPDTYAHRH